MIKNDTFIAILIFFLLSFFLSFLIIYLRRTNIKRTLSRWAADKQVRILTYEEKILDTGPFSPISVERNRCILFVTVQNEDGNQESYWLKIVKSFFTLSLREKKA